MKSLLTLSILLLCSAGFASEIGKLVTVKGTVSVVSLDGTVTEAKQLLPLVQGDKITTGPSSYVKLLMQDDSVFQVGPNSEFALEDFKFKTKNERTAVYNLAKGQLRSWFVHKSPDKTLTIKTPTASMGIRGTEILTDVYKDKSGSFKTDIALVRGKLEVAAAALGGKIMLSPGQLLDGLGGRIDGRAPASAKRAHLRNLSRKVFDAVRKNSIDNNGAIFLNDARSKFGEKGTEGKIFGAIQNSRGPASVNNVSSDDVKNQKVDVRSKLKEKLGRSQRNNLRRRAIASKTGVINDYNEKTIYAERKGAVETKDTNTDANTAGETPTYNQLPVAGGLPQLPPIAP